MVGFIPTSYSCVRFLIKPRSLQRLGRLQPARAATLLPLREELREHNGPSAAISQLLGVCKRGLTRAPGCQQYEGALPVWRQGATATR